jgi:hypothetical protein
LGSDNFYGGVLGRAFARGRRRGDPEGSTSVIALQGLPCGEVVSVKIQGDNDYIATCKDKNRYHVFVNSTGRVVAEKQ